jgi:hypothetical protein
MKPALRLPLAIAVLAVLSLITYNSYRARVETDAAVIERVKLKREFVERSSVGRAMPAAKQKEWADEAHTLLRWYFDELGAIRNRHPSEKRVEPPQVDPSKLKDADRAARQEFVTFTTQQFDALREGKYEPLFAGADQGLHLDLLTFGPAQNPAGGDRSLKVDFMLWGAPRRVERESASPGTRAPSKVVVPVVFKDLAFKFFDAQGKLYGGMSGSGEPYLKVADPERFLEDFPPSLIPGTWYLDLFPAEAAKVEITLALEVRGVAGADVVANYKWELPVRDEWKLRAGETYKAEVRQNP